MKATSFVHTDQHFITRTCQAVNISSHGFHFRKSIRHSTRWVGSKRLHGCQCVWNRLRQTAKKRRYLLLDSGHQSAHKEGSTMSYSECLKTLTSMPTWTHSDLSQSQDQVSTGGFVLRKASHSTTASLGSMRWHHDARLRTRSRLLHSITSSIAHIVWLRTNLLQRTCRTRSGEQRRKQQGEYYDIYHSITRNRDVWNLFWNLVLLVIMQLILAIWDRIAYLSRSILYKLILCYVYAAILLLSV